MISYLTFNVQGLSGPPQQAILQLFANSTSSTGVSIRGVSDTSWGERTITYANAPTVNPSVAGSSGPINTASTWVNIDITSLINGNGLVSVAVTTTNSTAISLASRESGAHAPQLLLMLDAGAPTPTNTPSSPTLTNTPTPHRPIHLLRRYLLRRPIRLRQPIHLSPIRRPTHLLRRYPLRRPIRLRQPIPLSSNTPTDTPTPTVSPTPSNTPTPTNTSLSNTPTDTPTPTITPTPTPTQVVSNITITPIADAYVNSSSPSTNYGHNSALREDASPDLHSYIKFNVQGLSGSPSQVTLRLYANSTSTTGVKIYGVSDTSWGETSITYSNAPAIDGPSGGSSGAIKTSKTFISIDITSLVTGNGTISIAVTTTNSTAISLASRESGANAPQLVILP